MIEQVILILHVLAAIAIIALVLLQQGKGADAGYQVVGEKDNRREPYETLWRARGSV